MTDTRRSILKLLGALPLTGSAATKAIATELAKPGVSAALMAVATVDARPPDSHPTPAVKAFGPEIGRYLGRLVTRAREERHSYSFLRQDSLDHDIAALKSCSRAYKVMKQHERDLRTIELHEMMELKVWG